MEQSKRSPKQKQSSKIPTYHVKDIRLESDDEKATAFANKLAKTFNEDEEDKKVFDGTHKSKVENSVDKFLQKTPTLKQPDISATISRGELETALKNLNSKKTLDCFNVSNYVGKKLVNSLEPHC